MRPWFCPVLRKKVRNQNRRGGGALLNGAPLEMPRLSRLAFQASLVHYCDEEVLRAGSDPQEYAEGNLKICKFYMESPLLCLSGVSGASLPKRIEATMRHRTLPRLNIPEKLILVAAGIFAVSGLVLVGVWTGPLIRAPSTPTATSHVLRSRPGICA